MEDSYNFGHWMHPSGVPYTQETMRQTAIDTFKILLVKNRRHDHFQDGSAGQALAFEDAMLRALGEVK
jgi:hypothetical protein